MPRPRRVAAAAIVLLAAGWAAAGGADPDAPAAPAPAGVPVEVVRADGTRFRGTFGPAVVGINTENYRADIDPAKIKLLTLDESDGRVVAAVTLTDGDLVEGRLTADTLTITVGDRPEVLRAGADVQQMTFLHPKHWSVLGAVVGLITLAVMEIVLGVDNIIVLALVSNKLPAAQRPQARRIGLVAALGTRLGLLLVLNALLGLTRPLFRLPDVAFLHIHSAEARGVSGRDLVLLAGGIFLIIKSLREMHEKVEEVKEGPSHPGADGVPVGRPRKDRRFWRVIAEIAFWDIIFSLDSVITAVGMVDEIWVMVGGMVIAMGVMLFAAGPIARFVERYPTVKVLALSFLVLIGLLLVAESLGQHFNKGYIYFAMAFGVAVEVTNIRLRRDTAKG